MLTNRYVDGIPDDSRAAKAHGFLKEKAVRENEAKVRKLAVIAQERGQNLAQMALAWVLRKPQVTSALIGASRKEQILENLAALSAAPFSEEEIRRIDEVLESMGMGR